MLLVALLVDNAHHDNLDNTCSGGGRPVIFILYYT